MLVPILLTSLILSVAYGVYFYTWWRSVPPIRPSVLVFSWRDQRVEVASALLIEWLALRQLASEEWPPMRDLLAASRMLGQPTTEEELRREVWRNLDRIRRAAKRGQDAISGHQDH